jgi:hypothetical protein
MATTALGKLTTGRLFEGPLPSHLLIDNRNHGGMGLGLLEAVRYLGSQRWDDF